jgi:methylenetetrahydrofolate dehydrogenase (NADP+)/methenyltetrahydrofolate cyclohydrolase
VIAQIIDGKSLSKNIIDELKLKLNDIRKNNKRLPGLAVILVGENIASAIYVGKKERMCESIGIISFIKRYDNNITEKSLIADINLRNENNDIDGILIQLPLPSHINQQNLISHVRPDKDVDGFHPFNAGNLFLGYNSFIPCTPIGIIKMLEYYKIVIKSKRVVILGRSNIVGKPLIPLFLKKDATITVCHSKTTNLQDIAKSADILIAAIGRPNFVKKEFVKTGAVVIDVGINRVDGKITGDVCFDEICNIASYITPVPGGVGPMTIAMLMHNTLKAYHMH